MIHFLRLQLRLNELLKEKKDLKSTSIYMERKVDELTGENGDLSFQVIMSKLYFLLNSLALDMLCVYASVMPLLLL